MQQQEYLFYLFLFPSTFGVSFSFVPSSDSSNNFSIFARDFATHRRNSSLSTFNSSNLAIAPCHAYRNLLFSCLSCTICRAIPANCFLWRSHRIFRSSSEHCFPFRSSTSVVFDICAPLVSFSMTALNTSEKQVNVVIVFVAKALPSPPYQHRMAVTYFVYFLLVAWSSSRLTPSVNLITFLLPVLFCANKM